MIDLDGTLLDNRTSINNANLDALKHFKEKGGEVVISTGRWPISSIQFNKMIEEHTNQKNKYLVTLNGALIYQNDIDEPIFEKTIDNNIFEKLLDVQKKFNAGMWIYSKEGINDRLIHSFKVPIKWFVSRFNYGKVVNYNGEHLTVYKILFGSLNHKKLEHIYTWLDKYFSEYVNIVKTSKKVIEVTPLGVDKGHALQFITERENISHNDVVCFGDSGNDISMFDLAGFRVCLNKKHFLLSSISNVVLKQKYGVKEGIEKFILKDWNFSNNNILVLNFGRTNFNIIEINEFVKNIHFWEYLKSNKPIVISTKYSLNDNLMMFKNLIDVNKNILIVSGDGSSIYSCKTKKLIKKSLLDETQLVLLSSFLNKSLKNEDVSIIVNQVSGSNLFLTKNPNNFINFIRNSGFTEDNFTVVDKDFEKYLSAKNAKFTNITMIGVDSIPKSINTNSLRISIRGNVTLIANKEDFLNDLETIVKSHFNCENIETVEVDNIIGSQQKLFDYIDNIIVEKFFNKD